MEEKKNFEKLYEQIKDNYELDKKFVDEIERGFNKWRTESEEYEQLGNVVHGFNKANGYINYLVMEIVNKFGKQQSTLRIVDALYVMLKDYNKELENKCQQLQSELEPLKLEVQGEKIDNNNILTSCVERLDKMQSDIDSLKEYIRKNKKYEDFDNEEGTGNNNSKDVKGKPK